MKRTISLIMVVSMLLVLFVSCGTDANDTTTNSPEASTTVTTETTTQEETTVEITTTVPETTETTTETPTTEETTTVETTTEPAPVEPVEKGPILHLDFEAEHIEGKVIKNVIGGGLDATITGNPEYVSGPTGGSAIHFGTSSVFDFLTIANDDRLNFETTDEFTIDFWYKLDQKAMGWDNLFSKGSPNNGWYGVWLGTSDATNQGVCWGGDTGNWRIGYLSSKEEWHHITVISKNGVIFMFLDGVQVNMVAAKRYVSSGHMYLGGRNSSVSDTDSSAQFHGCIDDFKIYDYALDLKVSGGLMAADSDTFEYTAENGDTISLPYRVYYPSDYDANGDKEYPILLFLHGHGECGTNNTAQLQVLNQSNKLLDDIAAMDNCIILAPQTYCDKANNYSEWVASGTGREYRHIWDGSMIHEDKKSGMPIRQGELDELTYTVGLQAASALLDEFLALDTVDKDRVYIGGISMGGCGTWEMIARRPETFAAAVPVCGSGILSTADTLTEVAIWAFHGTADTTVRPEGSELMVNAIKEAGGNATYTGFNGIGHSVWDYAYNAKNAEGQTAAEWLLEQSKAD